ncbi:hypothetical protein NM688_g1754 [Phlebia brevispora]|uniref:Uncharacterized protein n=1 Tax=Phlebia brevispora TaxID=194682 RepID=A0ACC1TAP9_9APHY|nr:hypothetical protein NM688_g1754 [Phlebia brevispora]
MEILSLAGADDADKPMGDVAQETDEPIESSSSWSRGKSCADGLPLRGRLSELTIPQSYQVLILEHLEEQSNAIHEQGVVNQCFQVEMNRKMQAVGTEVMQLKSLIVMQETSVKQKSGWVKLALIALSSAMPLPMQPASTASAATNATAGSSTGSSAVPATPQAIKTEENDTVTERDLPHNHLTKCVRLHLRLLLKLNSYRNVGVKYPPLTGEEINAIECDKLHAIQCTVDKFHIDFEHKWRKFDLNEQARTVFIKHFLAAIAGGSYTMPPIPPNHLTEVQVGIALDNHIEYVRKQYRDWKKKNTKELEAARNARKTVNSRRHTISGKPSQDGKILMSGITAL